MCRPVSQVFVEGQIFLGSIFFVYSEKNLSTEAHYQKGRLVKFINKMGYIGRVSPATEANKKFLKRLFDISLLMRVCSQEERRIIIDKLRTF